jgi:cbb3-type cytochrome c oxidase subunit III
MNKLPLMALILAFAIASCGKKEEPQTQQQNQQQQTQQQQTQQQQTQQTTSADDPSKKEEEKKREEERIKAEEKKKKEEEDKKKQEEEKKKLEEIKKQNELTSADVDFGPIFAKRCAKCHGKDGKGKLEGVPDLTSSDTKSKSEKQLISIITNGVKAETEEGEDMPAWKGKLTEEEIKAAAKYVKGL